MGVELIIAPEARQDLDQAYCWYERRRRGLGEEFLDCVDSCIHTICRMPELYAKVYKEYRRALIRRFPYAVFYEHTEGDVIVYCILHSSRNPEKWRDRLV